MQRGALRNTDEAVLAGRQHSVKLKKHLDSDRHIRFAGRRHRLPRPPGLQQVQELPSARIDAEVDHCAQGPQRKREGRQLQLLEEVPGAAERRSRSPAGGLAWR